MEKKRFEETEFFVIDLSEIYTDDVIGTSNQSPWDPVNYSGIKPALDFGNDAGIQGGAN